MSVACGECGAPMILRETTKFHTKDGKAKKFFGCSTFPRCRGLHGASPDGRPLGIPANAETKAARILAHAAFDRLWTEFGMERPEAYRWMREAMGLTKKQAHIAMLDAEQCRRLIQRVEEWSAQWNNL